MSNGCYIKKSLFIIKTESSNKYYIKAVKFIVFIEYLFITFGIETNEIFFVHTE